MAGYGGLFDRNAEGLADPPEARALVLEEGELRVGIAVLDLVIMRPELRSAIERRSQALELDGLLVTATHTHSGPGGYVKGFLAERITSGGFRDEAPEALAEAGHAALERALRDLQPAAAASGEGQVVLAENRRDEDGRDETRVPVLRLDRGDHPPILLFAYGMHPTVRSPGSRLYSADYVAPARAALETRGWKAVFLPGPLGDQGPPESFGPLWSGDPRIEGEQAREMGALLAEVAHTVASELSPEPGAALAWSERWLELPATQMRRYCPLWWLSPVAGRSMRAFLSERVPVQALAVANARLVALPAEPATALGDALRARIEPRVPFVIAHANDWIGYAVDGDAYRDGGYEACLSFHGPELGAWLVDAGASEIDALEAP
jgi:hypothetical protein